MPAVLDDEPVPADLDLLGALDRFQWPEDGDLDLDVKQSVRGHSRKARIGAAGRNGASRDHPSERLVGFNMPDAATQLSAVMQRDERSAQSRQDVGRLRQGAVVPVTFAASAPRAMPSSSWRSSLPVIG